MMKTGAALGLVALLIAACSSTTSSGSACQPQGTYVVSYVRSGSNPGDCPFPNGLKPDTTTVIQSGGNASVSFNGIGGSCDGPLDGACQLTCKQTFQDGGTLQLSWDFSTSGVKGLSTMVLVSTTGSGARCTASWNISGPKQ